MTTSTHPKAGDGATQNTPERQFAFLHRQIDDLLAERADLHAEISRLRRGPALVAYDLPLRPGLIVRITLPTDMTVGEAERLARIVRTIGFPDAATRDIPAGAA